jgi:hypothetical protein
MSTLPETTLETTETVTITETQEILIIATENKGKCSIWTLVCCHNVVPTIAPILPLAIVSFVSYSISLSLNNAIVNITEIDRYPMLSSPTLEVNIYESYPILINPDVNFFEWGVFPTIDFSSATGFTVTNLNLLNLASTVIYTLTPDYPLSPSQLSTIAANPNLYSQTPTLEISVVNE